MKHDYKNIKEAGLLKGLSMLLLILLMVTACTSEDELDQIEEDTEKQDATISFDPEIFGQSFNTAPDSTHFFDIKVEKGQKPASAFTVYEKVISEGVLVQAKTELTDYRMQLNGEEDVESISVAYYVPEERKNKDVITLEFVVEQEETEVSEALVIAIDKPEPEEDPIQEINDIIYYTQLSLGGQDNADIGGFFDVENALSLSLPEATGDQESVDFAMLVGASTGINFLVPASSGFQYFGSELRDAVYDGWATKNDGEFVNIGNLSEAEAIFDELEFAADILSAYDEAKATVTDIPGYVENENGPGDRVRRVNVGDVIFFKAESGVTVVLKVTSILPDTGGNVEFEMKIAADPTDTGDGLAYFPEIEIGGQDNTEIGSFFNIASQTAYNMTDATNNQADIDLIMLVGASTGVNFLAPASSGLQYFGSDIDETVYEGWTTKNDGQWVDIGNDGTATLFDELSTSEELTDAYQTALAEVEDMEGYVENENGPGDRIRRVEQGDVIFFSAEDGTLIVIKMTQIASETTGSVTFEMKTADN